MTKAQLLAYLRSSVNVQTAEGTDPNYLSLSDDDLTAFLEVAKAREYPSAILDALPDEAAYIVVLVAKKELYYALATRNANNIDMGADNNNYLKRSQKFTHYLALISIVEEELQYYLDNGGAGGGRNTLVSHDILLPTRYYTARNHDLGVVPEIILSASGLTENSVDLSWVADAVSQFAWYKVYVSTVEPVIDLYLENPIRETADLVATILDQQRTKTRLINLSPDTTYYITVALSTLSNLVGYSSITVLTAEAVV